jgi:5-formyltetrahydrofolate cyclo-ligase
MGKPSKQSVRERVWKALEESGDARFPGATGRIPNFKGAEEAAERLAQTEEWKRARVLKCNPDSPQHPVRLRALRERKLVYMAVPRLRTVRCFWALDPKRIPDLEAAARIRGAKKYGVPVHPSEMSEVDLIICGSVAVDCRGVRVGKGGGYSDLEFALARQFDLVTGDTPIATTIHSLQLVERSLPRSSYPT